MRGAWAPDGPPLLSSGLFPTPRIRREILGGWYKIGYRTGGTETVTTRRAHGRVSDASRAMWRHTGGIGVHGREPGGGQPPPGAPRSKVSGGPGGSAPRRAAGPPLERTPTEFLPLKRWQLRRKQAYELRHALRPHSRTRVAKCGWTPIDPNVTVMLKDGRAYFGGIMTCGSVWECPACSLKIKAERARELQSVVEDYGVERCIMATLTIRHSWGMEAKPLRQGLTASWQRRWSLGLGGRQHLHGGRSRAS